MLYYSICGSALSHFWQDHTLMLDIKSLKVTTLVSEKRPIDCFVLRDEEIPAIPYMYPFSPFGVQSHACLRQMASVLCDYKTELCKLLAPGLNLWPQLHFHHNQGKWIKQANQNSDMNHMKGNTALEVFRYFSIIQFVFQLFETCILFSSALKTVE